MNKFDRLLIFALWATYVFAGSHTTIITDSARDLIAAWDIVQGQNFPLRGPILYNTWNLGPIWFYLLALPLLFTHSAAVTASLMAALAGLKFFLAYRLGQVFDGVMLARLSLFAIAMPGWWLFEWEVSSHTILAATCVLGYALMLLQWAKGGADLKLVAAAFLFSLALHAHPTSIFWSWLGILAFANRYRLGVSSLRRYWLLAALLFLFPFLPVLFDEARLGWPMFAGTKNYMSGVELSSTLHRLPGFLLDMGGLNPLRVPAQFLPADSLLRVGLLPVNIMLCIATFAGLVIGRAPTVNYARFSLLVFLSGSMFLLPLRTETPFWMTLMLAPGLAAVQALSWLALARSLREVTSRRAMQVLGIVLLAEFFVLAGVKLQTTQGTFRSLPYLVVGNYVNPEMKIDSTLPSSYFSVFHQEAFVRWLCSQQRLVSLHGDIAALQRMTQGILRALHCENDIHWQIGGNSAESFAAYPMYALRQAGIIPVEKFGSMGRVPVVKVLHMAESETEELIRDYPPWKWTMDATEKISVALDKPGLLVVTNLRILFNALETPELILEGKHLPYLTRTGASWFYRIPESAQHGELRFRTGDARRVEVLLLADSSN